MGDEFDRRKRPRDDSAESDSPDSAAAKKIREDFLVLLDDYDAAPSGDGVGGESDIRELDSVVKSFEEELSGSTLCIPAAASASCSAPVVDLANSESHTELGFLLGASDDELGLPSTEQPPETTVPELVCDRAAGLFRASLESYGGGDLWQFYDEFLIHDDSFGFDVSGDVEDTGNDYLALDGIFDYSDVNFGPSDYTNNTWRQETLPAL